LLVKRFRKGKTSNFALESFITTEAGKALFREATRSDRPNDADAEAPPLKALADMDVFVVDDEIQELDGSSIGSVLVAVLEQLLETVRALHIQFRMKAEIFGVSMWEPARCAI
jgi:hypothetical protein